MNKKNSDERNVLFTPSNVVRGNVVLNFLESPISEFPRYANAFRNAAWKLATIFANARGYNDLDALPIVYLYRHSVELFLKGILIVWRRSKSLQEGKTNDLKDLLTGHRLTPLLNGLDEACRRCGWDWPPLIEHDNVKISLEKIIRELDEVDVSAFAFRYPVKKDLESSLPKHFIFHLYHFSEKMEATCSILGGVCTAFEAEFDSICESIDQIVYG